MPKLIAETDLSRGTNLKVYLCECARGFPLEHAFLVVDGSYAAGPFFSNAGLVAFTRTRLMEEESPMLPDELSDALNFFAKLSALPNTAMPFDLAASGFELLDLDDEHVGNHLKFDDRGAEDESPRFKDRADGQAKFILCGCGGHGWIIDGLGNVLADDLVTQPYALEVLENLVDHSQVVSIFDQPKVTREIKESELFNPEVATAALA
jgi:hypothetical protein